MLWQQLGSSSELPRTTEAAAAKRSREDFIVNKVQLAIVLEWENCVQVPLRREIKKTTERFQATRWSLQKHCLCLSIQRDEL